MAKESLSNTDISNSKILYKEDLKTEEYNLLKAENTTLKGEISLLRQNMLQLEKSNYELRLEKSETNKSMYLNSKKADLELLKIQCKINENKPSIFKRSANSNYIDVKWALEHSNSDINFKLEPFEYNRLKFFKEYFYNDFYQFDTKEIIKYIDKFSKEKYKKFLDYFELFACKLDVFNRFFHLVFINNHFIDKKVLLFDQIPLDLIINFRNGDALPLLKEFIERYTEKMIIFMYRVISERPFITNLLINTKTFTKMISQNDYTVKFLKNIISEQGGLNLINKHNIHLFNKEQLKKIYKDDYMDIL